MPSGHLHTPDHLINVLVLTLQLKILRRRTDT